METEGKNVFHHPPRVVSFGEILFDVIDGVPWLGGAPLNLAVHLHRQGAETTLISAVGADPLGRSALKQIQEFGLDTGSIAVLEQFPTGTVTVLSVMFCALVTLVTMTQKPVQKVSARHWELGTVQQTREKLKKVL